MDVLQLVAKALGFVYEEVPSSFMEALKLNGTTFLHGLLNDFHPLNEADPEYAIDFEFEKEFFGGVIVFSTNVNAITDSTSKSKWVGKIKGIIKTIQNRVYMNKKLNAILLSHSEVKAVSIGNFFKGRYTAKNNTTYDETSLSIEIIGISFELLCGIAAELSKTFSQETVLVKGNDSQRILLVKAV